MQWFSLSKINDYVVWHVPFLDPLVISASLRNLQMCSSSRSPSRTHSIHLTFFSKKSTRPPLEYGPHSDVRKIRWPRVTYKALYTSSWCCDSNKTLVAPVVSPRPADCNDVLEKFRNENSTSLRRVGYCARGNSIKSPCSNISAYLEK